MFSRQCCSQLIVGLCVVLESELESEKLYLSWGKCCTASLLFLGCCVLKGFLYFVHLLDLYFFDQFSVWKAERVNVSTASRKIPQTCQLSQNFNQLFCRAIVVLLYWPAFTNMDHQRLGVPHSPVLKIAQLSELSLKFNSIQPCQLIATGHLNLYLYQCLYIDENHWYWYITNC